MRRPMGWVIVVAAVAGGTGLFAAIGEGSRGADQQALGGYATLVGSWKGTGQPQRNSPRGAWRESAEWAWVLTPDSAALRLTVEDGKFLKSITLRPGVGAGQFLADVEPVQGPSRRYTGAENSRHVLTLRPAAEAAGNVASLTLTPLHETRFLLLLEGPRETGASSRLAEVGYTRQGVSFAVGDSYPVCIVTGGRGTIRVSHKGKDYWVCCTGCKELFDEEPDRVIAEAEARREAKP